MARDDEVIADAVVKVGPDLAGFRTKLDKDLAKATKGLQAKIKVVADTTGLRESVRVGVAKQMALANQPVYKVKVVADMQGFNRSLKQIAQAETQARANRQRGEVAAEKTVQQGRVRAAEQGAKDRARVEQKSLRDQERALKARNKVLFTSPRLIDYGGAGIKPMNLLYGVVTAMTPALFAMSASAVQASTSVAALGSAGIGAALGLSGVLVAFQGIGDALSLRKSVLAQETTGAANAAQKAVRSADDLAQAKRTLADAQRDEAKAAADVHKARREAVRDLEDLKQAVIDLDNQYRNDTLSVAEAKQNLQATDRNFFATALDRARARQDLRDAQTRLSDTALERKQKKTDLRESVRKGVEGSDKVKDAKERARDARDATLNAQASLRGSSATAGGLGKVTSAAALLEAKIKELSPAAQEMYYWFDKNEGLFKRLQREISQKTLPGFNDFLTAITTPVKGKTTLQLAADYAGDLGAIIGKYAGKIGEFTKSALFRDSMARMQKINAKAFENLGKALLILADPITRILDKAAPGFESLSEVILTLSERFADWIKVLDENGGLSDWFKDSRTELGKWFDIVKNIGTVFKNIFTASLPAGGDLVTNFRDFTKSIADWSSSAKGQKQLQDFFTDVKNLPYAKIADFFKNAATFFVAFRAFKYLVGLNPFFTAFAAFAASNPALAADAISVVADKIAWALEQIVKHPEAAAALVGIIAAARLGKAVGIDFKIPVMDKLRDALVGKFKVLDKFIGGGAKTATMTVQAGIVNIYGKAIGGGLPGVGGGPGGPGGKTPKGTRLSNAVGTGGVITAAALAGYVFGMDELDRAKDILSGNKTEAFHTWSDAIKKKPFDWDNWYQTFVDNSAVVMIPLIADKLLGGGVKNRSVPNFAAKPIAEEKNAFTRLKEDLFLGGGFDNATAQASLKTYIANRKTAVDAYVRWVRSDQGPEAAQRAEREEVDKSKKSLELLYLQYGYTAEEAKKYADKAYAAGDESSKAADKVNNLNSKLGTLSERLDNVTGVKQIVLDIQGQEKVFATLEAAVAYQQAIRMGVQPNQSKLNQLKRQMEKQTGEGGSGAPTPSTPKPRTGPGSPGYRDPKKKPGYRAPHADGGMIDGYSPHDKADNIPAWLTANEYVQPVAAVKHYGTDFMEAIRTRRFPKFAGGGPVKWPVKMTMPNALKPVESFLTMGAGSDQEYTGRTPGGLGAVAGLGNRMMAAVMAIHQQFPWASVISGYRPGAITVTGNKSYHGKRRATDWPASMELFNYFVQRYGNVAKEIIYSPAGGAQIWNTKPHMYTGAVRATHWNHVHLALGDGGPVRKYDTGGTLPPGYSTVYNGTGSNETVRTKQQEQALSGPVRLDPRDVALLAGAVARTGTPAVTMDGRRVAEVTNRYNYMPSGV